MSEPREAEVGDIVEFAHNVRMKVGAVPVVGQRHHEDIEAEVWIEFVGKHGGVMAAVEVSLPYHALVPVEPTTEKPSRTEGAP